MLITQQILLSLSNRRTFITTELQLETWTSLRKCLSMMLPWSHFAVKWIIPLVIVGEKGPVLLHLVSFVAYWPFVCVCAFINGRVLAIELHKIYCRINLSLLRV